MKNELLIRILSSITIIPIVLFFIIKGSFFFIFFLIVFFLISSIEWFQMNKNTIYKYIGSFFLLISCLSAFYIRGDTVEELNFFLFIILICVLTDIGGFVFGKIFKGPKLTKISPNKTYSGMIGGYLLSIILVFVIFSNENYELIKKFNKLSEIKFLILVFLISSISQVGDLIISYFKRQSKIKNTGKIIPGHGGLLDRVDGIIFAIPFSYVLLKFI